MTDGDPENPAQPQPPAKQPDPPSTKQPRRPRKWLRRIGLTLLVLFAVLVIFHRPILKAVIHAAAVKIAAQQHINLSLDVGGTVLTNLSLENIRADPAGTGATPVERIRIDEVRVSYSIPSLIRGGVSEFLESYGLRNAEIVVKPVEGTKKQKRDLASTLHGIIQQPALFSDRVNVQNLNLVAHVPDGEFALEGVRIFLDPIAEGYVSIDKIQVPRVRTWTNLSATATYANRDLILRGLTIDPEMVIHRLELDASRRAEGINRLAVEGSLFGGTSQLSLDVRETGGTHTTQEGRKVKKVRVDLDARLAGLSLEKASRYFGSPKPVSGTVTEATLDLAGDPNVPASWTGSMSSLVEAVKAGGTTLDRMAARLVARDGNANLNVEVNSGQNRVSLAAGGALPKAIDQFAAADLDGKLEISAEELSRFAAPITGGLIHCDGIFSLKNRTFRLELSAAARQLAMEKLSLSTTAVKLELVKLLAPAAADPQAPVAPFDGLQAQLGVTFQELRADKYALDSGALDLSIRDDLVEIKTLQIRRGPNAITATAEGTMPRDMKSWAAMPAKASFEVKAPNVAALAAEPDLTAPNANLAASGTLSNGADGYEGRIDVAADGITVRDFSAESLNVNIAIDDNIATIETLSLKLNAADGLTGSGQVGLRKPFTYDARLQGRVRDLSTFNAFVPDMKGRLAGRLALDWTGQGNIQEIQHTGDVKLTVENGKVADVQAINAEIAGQYSPEFINMPTFRVNTSKGDLSLVIAMGNSTLAIRDILVKLGGKTVVTGSLALPVDLRTPAKPETIIQTSGPVVADIQTTELNLADLPKLEGTASSSASPAKPAGNQSPAKKKGARAGPPVRGVVSASLTARGTIDELDARLTVTGRDIYAGAMQTLAPASVDLAVQMAADQLSVKGTVRQPRIQPVEITGSTPMAVEQILKRKKFDQNAPIQLSVRLPRSDMAFISELSPLIRYVEGSAALDVNVSGSVAQPQFDGTADIDLEAVRLRDQNMPAINNLQGDLRFSGSQLTITRFSGSISGGTVNLTGNVQFPKLTEPQFNLQLTSDNALVARSETLTVRVDSDIRLTGPLAAATVAGTIGVTRSRFFKEIEILPIELPGRPAPKPPETTPGFSIDKPPLRDWIFNLAIKTKDPFGIRGNLANGAAHVDLKLIGTGQAPALDGVVRIENFVASLPFSRLSVNRGFVYFSPDDPFVPKLDIQASSEMRDYNIGVYIYGTATAPQTVFSSEPPLPQEDIIALLATGTTVSDLTNNTDALAGRAAVLALQSLYRKVFKTREPSENESLLSRLNVDVGGVDPRTGQQEVTTRFKLGDNFYIIGDLDVGGNLRGQLKYLLRFR